MNDPIKFVISKKWKSMIALPVHNVWGLFPDGLSLQMPECLAMLETCPTMFGKIPGGGVELNETQTNPESWEHKNK